MIKNIAEAKAQLSSLVEEVLKGNEVILAKAGKPVVRLVVFEYSSQPRKPGALAGRISIAPDFDTLPPEESEAFGMVDERK